MLIQNHTFSESPSHERAKDEVIDRFPAGADQIDVLGMARSLHRFGITLDDWCPLNREKTTARRSLSVSFESIDGIGDKEAKLRNWSHRSFRWVGRFMFTFSFCDKIFSFTIERDSEGYTKVYNHLLVTVISK